MPEDCEPALWRQRSHLASSYNQHTRCADGVFAAHALRERQGHTLQSRPPAKPALSSEQTLKRQSGAARTAAGVSDWGYKPQSESPPSGGGLSYLLYRFSFLLRENIPIAPAAAMRDHRRSVASSPVFEGDSASVAFSISFRLITRLLRHSAGF